MKKGGFICLALLLVLTACVYASANEADDRSIMEVFDDLTKEKGPLVYTLPEDADVSLTESIPSYLVTWEPIEGVHAYQMGVAVLAKEGYFNEYAVIVEGWMGANYIENGEGEKFFVQNVIFDSILLDRDAVKADIAPQISRLAEMDIADKAVACYLIALVIPESGEPVVQAIPIPLTKKQP